MRPIRVMHILSDFDLGGAQRVVLDITRNLDRSRFAPQVCCLRSGGMLLPQLEKNHIPCHLAYFSNRLSIMGLLRLRALLCEQQIDIVHTHLRRANLSGRLAAVLAGTPVIIAHAHDTFKDARGYHRWLNRWLLKRTARFLCISDAVAELQAAEMRLPQSFFTTMYNFIEPAEFQTDLSMQLARADFGVPADGPCVGIVGRLHPVKRHDLFLETALRLNQYRPDIHFIIAGDGALKDSLRARANEMGMAHKIAFTGFVHDIARLYRTLNCLVLTSDSEGMGKVILEAQAAGVPVVARNVGGVPEALAAGGGLLVNDASPEAFASAIEAALKPRTAALLRSQMAINLRRFNAGRLITELEDIYEETCRAKGIGMFASSALPQGVEA